MTDRPRIVNDLDRLRERAGLTVYALAKAGEVSPQAAAALLSGSGAKTIEHLDALGKALGLRLSWEPIPKRGR